MDIEFIISSALIFIFGSTMFIFLTSKLSFIFWGKVSLITADKHKLMLLSIIRSSISVPFLFFPISKTFYSFSVIVLSFILFLLFYMNRGLTFKDCWRIFSLAYIIHFFIEIVTFTIIFQFIKIDDVYLLKNILIYNIPFWTLFAISILFINKQMVRKKVYVGESILNYIQETKKYKLSLLMTFTAVQFIAIAILVAHFITTEGWTWIGIIGIFIISIISLCLIFISLKVIAQSKNEGIRTAQEVYIDGINQMFLSLRGQRHDFLNHVQIVSALAKSGKLHEAEQYLDQTLEEVTKMSDVVQIGDPAICALIQLKLAHAESYHIQFKYDIPQYGSLELGAKSIDLVKILSNLIDNAFEEVMKMPVEQRWVDINGWSDENNLYVSVQNSISKYVDQEEAQSYFDVGVSYKKENHSGLGLAIAKQKIKEYKGDITVQTNKEQMEIQFELKFPIAKMV